MKRWQQFWLWLVVVYSLLHLVRDVFQDLGIQNFLSTVLVRPETPRPPLYWKVLNTYAFAFLEIFLASLCLQRKKFGRLGYLTILIAVFILFAWSYYWFFL